MQHPSNNVITIKRNKSHENSCHHRCRPGRGSPAAYDLKKQKQSGNELRVILLEESGEIGGISRTVRHNGCRIDLGGHRFFSKNEQVNALWQEIMPSRERRRWTTACSRATFRFPSAAPTRSGKTG